MVKEKKEDFCELFGTICTDCPFVSIGEVCVLDPV